MYGIFSVYTDNLAVAWTTISFIWRKTIMESKNTTNLTITPKCINDFSRWLLAEEREKGTIEKYTRDLRKLSAWLGDRAISKENLVSWKEQLVEDGYEAVTVNSMLAVANTYCRYIGLNIKVKFLRIQRKLFRDESKELAKAEYERLIAAAKKKGNHRLALLIETIGATGIRVSEVQYILVEAVKAGRTQVSLKGKIRDILLPGKLCRKLLKYAKKQKIASGEIFITKSGKSVSRQQIWAEMKALCKEAGVEESKVFPHNLRHLFARVFYKATRDVAKLADILGHCSIETTRIYLLSTGAEHVRQLEELGLVQ